jgi:sarcosine oxidase gamma subunit
VIARAGVIVELVDAGPTWRIYVARSLASYLASWLVDAMGEFRGGTEPTRP